MFSYAASKPLCLRATNDSFCTPVAGHLRRQAVRELEQTHGSAAGVAEQSESEGMSSKLPQHTRYK